MKKAATLTLILALLFSAVAGALVAKKARAGTITVPDDYATIQDAVNAADEGDTVFVRKGTYEGPINQTLMINKTLSLIGEDSNHTSLNLHPAWVTTIIFPDTRLSGYDNPIKIEANNVRVAGFTIASDGGDISVTGNGTQMVGNILNTGLTLRGSNQTLAKNTITARISVLSSYCNIYANNVANTIIDVTSGAYNSLYVNSVGGGGLGAGGTSSTNLIYGNTVKNGGGIWACDGDIVANNTVTDCDKGVSITWGFNNIICGNFIINNHGPGLTKDEGLNNTFYANHVANNSVGVLLGTRGIQHSGNTTLFHNNFIDNIQQTQIVNLDHSDYWDNGEEGNFWSDYSGSDSDHDGIGDAPYVMTGDSYHENYPYVTYGDSYEDRYPLMAPFGISSVTVSLPDWAPNVSSVNPELPEWAHPLSSPTSSPSQEPTSQPEPQQAKPFPLSLVVAIAIVAADIVVIAAVGIGLSKYLKKHK